MNHNQHAWFFLGHLGPPPSGNALNIVCDVTESDVIWAMSVVPICWLSAGDIAGEMGFEDGRSITPILKRLMKEGKIVRYQKGGRTEWRLSPTLAEKTIKKFEELT